jgi:hypothetical protein
VWKLQAGRFPDSEQAHRMSTAGWLNFLMYEVGWLACVLGAAWGFGGPGSAFASLLVAVHIGLATERSIELRLAFVSLLLGCIVDTICIRAGVLHFAERGLIPGFPPFWMTVLWVQFATTLRYSLAWLQGHLLLAGIFGLVGAPAAFLGGARLGAVRLCSPAFPGLLLLGVLWAIAMPLLGWLSRRLGRQHVSAGYLLPQRTG